MFYNGRCDDTFQKIKRDVAILAIYCDTCGTQIVEGQSIYTEKRQSVGNGTHICEVCSRIETGVTLKKTSGSSFGMYAICGVQVILILIGFSMFHFVGGLILAIIIHVITRMMLKSLYS